ncbi:hypothetical protein TNCV_2460861 [Trichonephila clavipes]|nr:hypothetical protein TNCV_2460861 [Trichonephila clavipes]
MLIVAPMQSSQENKSLCKRREDNSCAIRVIKFYNQFDLQLSQWLIGSVTPLLQPRDAGSMPAGVDRFNECVVNGNGSNGKIVGTDVI